MIGFIINLLAALANVLIGFWQLDNGYDPTFSFCIASFSAVVAVGFLLMDLVD